MSIALIDYGAGNLHSVENALRAAGATDLAVTADADLPATIDDARVVDEAALRSDEPGPVLGAEAVTRIAPASRDGQISVPRVVDDES